METCRLWRSVAIIWCVAIGGSLSKTTHVPAVPDNQVVTIGPTHDVMTLNSTEGVRGNATLDWNSGNPTESSLMDNGSNLTIHLSNRSATSSNYTEGTLYALNTTAKTNHKGVYNGDYSSQAENATGAMTEDRIGTVSGDQVTTDADFASNSMSEARHESGRRMTATQTIATDSGNASMFAIHDQYRYSGTRIEVTAEKGG